MIAFGGVGEQAVGDVEHGLHGTVVLFEPYDARIAEQFGKIENIVHRGAPEGVDGLRVVAHGHDVAFFSGQHAHESGLHLVGVLIFVHHDLAEAQFLRLKNIGLVDEELLEFEEQIVVVHEGVFAFVFAVGFAELHEVRGVGQQVLRFAAEHFLKFHFLVARLAEQAEHGLGAGKASVALAYFQIFLAGLDGGGAVGRVHDGERAARPVRAEAAQYGKGEAVKGAALHAEKLMIQKIRGTVQHFLRSLAREGEQQHGVRIDAVFGKPRQTVHDGAGLAGTGAGHDQHGACGRGDGLFLGLVENGKIEHGISLSGDRRFHRRREECRGERRLRADASRVRRCRAE